MKSLEKDFKKKRVLVGRKVKKKETTKIAVKSKYIKITQDIDRKSSSASKNNDETIAQYIKQLSHANPIARETSLDEINLFMKSKSNASSYISLVFPSITERLFDDEIKVRKKLVDVYTALLPSLQSNSLMAVSSVLITYLSSGLTHLRKGIRKDSVRILLLFCQFHPKCVSNYTYKLLSLVNNVLADQLHTTSSISSTEAVTLLSTSSDSFLVTVLQLTHQLLATCHELIHGSSDKHSTSLSSSSSSSSSSSTAHGYTTTPSFINMTISSQCRRKRTYNVFSNTAATAAVTVSTTTAGDAPVTLRHISSLSSSTTILPNQETSKEVSLSTICNHIFQLWSHFTLKKSVLHPSDVPTLKEIVLVAGCLKKLNNIFTHINGVDKLLKSILLHFPYVSDEHVKDIYKIQSVQYLNMEICGLSLDSQVFVQTVYGHLEARMTTLTEQLTDHALTATNNIATASTVSSGYSATSASADSAAHAIVTHTKLFTAYARYVQHFIRNYHQHITTTTTTAAAAAGAGYSAGGDAAGIEYNGVTHDCIVSGSDSDSGNASEESMYRAMCTIRALTQSVLSAVAANKRMYGTVSNKQVALVEQLVTLLSEVAVADSSGHDSGQWVVMTRKRSVSHTAPLATHAAVSLAAVESSNHSMHTRHDSPSEESVYSVLADCVQTVTAALALLPSAAVPQACLTRLCALLKTFLVHSRADSDSETDREGGDPDTHHGTSTQQTDHAEDDSECMSEEADGDTERCPSQLVRISETALNLFDIVFCESSSSPSSSSSSSSSSLLSPNNITTAATASATDVTTSIQPLKDHNNNSHYHHQQQQQHQGVNGMRVIELLYYCEFPDFTATATRIALTLTRHMCASTAAAASSAVIQRVNGSDTNGGSGSSDSSARMLCYFMRVLCERRRVCFASPGDFLALLLRIAQSLTVTAAEAVVGVRSSVSSTSATTGATLSVFQCLGEMVLNCGSAESPLKLLAFIRPFLLNIAAADNDDSSHEHGQEHLLFTDTAAAAVDRRGCNGNGAGGRNGVYTRCLVVAVASAVLRSWEDTVAAVTMSATSAAANTHSLAMNTTTEDATQAAVGSVRADGSDGASGSGTDPSQQAEVEASTVHEACVKFLVRPLTALLSAPLTTSGSSDGSDDIALIEFVCTAMMQSYVVTSGSSIGSAGAATVGRQRQVVRIFPLLLDALRLSMQLTPQPHQTNTKHMSSSKAASSLVNTSVVAVDSSSDHQKKQRLQVRVDITSNIKRVVRLLKNSKVRIWNGSSASVSACIDDLESLLVDV